MARVREQQLNKTEQLTPAARLVDTFVAPENNNDAFVKAQRLNAALGKFADGAKDYMAVKQQVITEENIIEGQAAATQSKVDFKTAINEGLIPAGASPWYRQGYEREDGDRLAQQYSKESAMAYSKWTGKETASPEDYNDWISGIRKDFTAKNLNSPNQMAGFMKRANASDASNSAKHTTAVVTKMEFDRHQVTTGNITADIQGYLNGEMLNEELVENTLRRAEQYFLDGATGKQVRESVVTAFLLQAKDNLDETLIDKLLELNISGRGKLGTMAGVSEKAETLRGTIRTKKYTQQTRVAAQNKLKKEQFVVDGYVTLFTNMNGNALHEFSEEDDALYRQMITFDPDVVSTINKFRNIAKTTATREDDIEIAKLTIQAYEGMENVEVFNLLKTGGIKDANTAQALLSIINSRKTQEEAKRTRLESKATQSKNALGKEFKQDSRTEKLLLGYKKAIRDILAGDEFKFNAEKRQLANDAETLFSTTMFTWLHAPENDDATEMEILNYGQKLKNTILSLNEPDAVTVARESKRVEGNLVAAMPLVKKYGTVEWITLPLFESVEELQSLKRELFNNPNAVNKFSKMVDEFGLTTEDLKDFADQQERLLKEQSPSSTQNKVRFQ